MLTLSTTTETPSTSKTWSSSLAWSKASAYWKPEQPPPRTATRSACPPASSWEPSSSAILPAALSVRAIAVLSLVSHFTKCSERSARIALLEFSNPNCGRLRHDGLPAERAARLARDRDDQPLRLGRRPSGARVRDQRLRRLLRAPAGLGKRRDDLAALDRRLPLGLRAAARRRSRNRLDPHLRRHLRHLRGRRPGSRAADRRGQGGRAHPRLRLALGRRRHGPLGRWLPPPRPPPKATPRRCSPAPSRRARS